MKIMFAVLASLLVFTTSATADETMTMIEATTASGDLVKLDPNGRWEFVDSEKAKQAATVAKQFPENRGCPAGAQGQFFGIGKCIMPGDKEFNRGSLGGKGR